MTQAKRWKKPLWIALAVVGALVISAVLLGVLNGLVGNGEWTFFWSDYRYDDTGYTVGDGTVYADSLTEIDVDWIDGSVQIVVCGDTYPSVSERISREAPESRRMRFCVSEDGKTLFVKYRAPSYFLGKTENEQKELIVRIPERMLGGMDSLRLKTVSGSVSVEAIPFDKISIETSSGAVTLAPDACTEEASLTTKSGDVTLLFESTPSLSIRYQSGKNDVLLSDFPYEKTEDIYLYGEGKTAVNVSSGSGELTVKKKK
jgi:hypothetical protein